MGKYDQLHHTCSVALPTEPLLQAAMQCTAEPPEPEPEPEPAQSQLMSGSSQSCDTACAAHGGCDQQRLAAIDHVECASEMARIGELDGAAPGDPQNCCGGFTYRGMGCMVEGQSSARVYMDGYGASETDHGNPATCSASQSGWRRLCACRG